MEKRNPTQHRMTRRAAAHDYTLPGIYHITLHVAEGLGQPFGAVVGTLSAPDGSADAPHTALTPAGQMVEHELLTAIHEHYSMITIQDYVVMPEHLHFIAVVQDKILSRNGKTMSLGQVIAGFKKGCNKRYWEMIGNSDGMPNCGGQTAITAGGQTAAHTSSSAPAGSTPAAPSGNTPAVPAGRTPAAPSGNTPAPPASSTPAAPAGSVPGGLPAGYKVPSYGTTGRPPLFAANYCDVMPVDAAQLATQRAYIAGNPRSRLLRMSNRTQFTVQHGGIDTALTLPALLGYLQRECPPHLATPEALAAIEGQLLLTPAEGAAPTAAHPVPSGLPAGIPTAAKRFIACDTYGDRALLQAPRLLPVVCHRKDEARRAEQHRRCLEAAAQGAVLVSPRIAPGEQTIIDDAVNHGFPVILIADNGFTDRYHPSTQRLDLCAEGRLLLLTPWRYQYRGKNEQITVPFCKTMNCVAQALCRCKDSWWKASKK